MAEEEDCGGTTIIAKQPRFSFCISTDAALKKIICLPLWAKWVLSFNLKLAALYVGMYVYLSFKIKLNNSESLNL